MPFVRWPVRGGFARSQPEVIECPFSPRSSPADPKEDRWFDPSMDWPCIIEGYSPVAEAESVVRKPSSEALTGDEADLRSRIVDYSAAFLLIRLSLTTRRR